MSGDEGLRRRSRLLLLLALGLLILSALPGLVSRLRHPAGWPPPREIPGAVIDLRSVDVNRAPADELETLPGIGPALAARIVAERERGGRFASVRDLGRVKGIGPSLQRTLEPYLVFSP